MAHKLTNFDLLAVSTLIYAIHRTQLNRRDLTVGLLASEVLDEITRGALPKSPAGTSKKEWTDLIDYIHGSPTLATFRLKRLKFHKGLLVFTLVDNPILPKDVYIVFRGTATRADWDDNAIASYTALSPLQRAAIRYVNTTPLRYGNHIVATGHSKGGSHAQLVAIMNRRVTKAVCFNSGGFSPEFISKYRYRINKYSHRITIIAAASDIVHALLTQLKGAKVIFIDSPSTRNFVNNHRPTAMMDFEHQKLYPEINRHKISGNLVEQLSMRTASNLTLTQRKKLAHAMMDAFKLGRFDPLKYLPKRKKSTDS